MRINDSVPMISVCGVCVLCALVKKEAHEKMNLEFYFHPLTPFPVYIWKTCFS